MEEKNFVQDVITGDKFSRISCDKSYLWVHNKDDEMSVCPAIPTFKRQNQSSLLT